MGAKMGIVAIGIGIGIGIGLGSVETVLHIFIEPNFIGIGMGVGVGIGVGQWKHTIRTETSTRHKNEENQAIFSNVLTRIFTSCNIQIGSSNVLKSRGPKESVAPIQLCNVIITQKACVYSVSLSRVQSNSRKGTLCRQSTHQSDAS